MSFRWHICLVLSALAVFVGVGAYDAEAAGAAQDTVLTAQVRERLEKGLEEYFRALERESVRVKEEECDFIIGACEVEEVRRFTALKVYAHFMGSPVMGDEAVAIHVFDRWFADGTVAMESDVEFMNARIFADFNRSSLIGMKAPELSLYAHDGSRETLFADGSGVGRFSLLLFYDTGCATCRVEIPRLRKALADNEYWPMDVYAVYVGDDADKWAAFRESFGPGTSGKDESAPGVRVKHFYDPDMDSGFQQLYGVLQTPKMFLIDPEGVIIGRNLDTGSLTQMMESLGQEYGQEGGYEYGGEESSALFSRMLPGDRLSREDILAVAEDIREATLGRGDTLAYKHLEGDFLYWLSGRRGEEVKLAQKDFIDSYIHGSGLYTSRSDSLQVLGLADMISGLLALTPAGSKVRGVTVPGKLLTAKGMKEGKFALDRLGGRPSYILFYSERCSSCAGEFAAADSLLRLPSMKRAKALEVDIDDVLANYPAVGRELLANFDLSSTPFLIETDRKGTVRRKYFSIRDLLPKK